MKLINYLSADSCPIVNLFIDWNPIYTDDYVAGEPGTLWTAQSEEDVNPWAKLIESSKKLQVLFARSCRISDSDLEAMCGQLANNTSVRVLDLSSNTELAATKTIGTLSEMMSSNRSLEYIGLSKLGIDSETVKPIFEMIGRFPFPEDQVND